MGRLSFLKARMGTSIALLFVVLLIFIIAFGVFIHFITYNFVSDPALYFNVEGLLRLLSGLFIFPIVFVISLNFLMDFVYAGSMKYPNIYLQMPYPYNFYFILYRLYLIDYIIPNRILYLVLMIALAGTLLISFSIILQLLIGPWMVRRSLPLTYLYIGVDFPPGSDVPWLVKTVMALAEKSGVPTPRIAMWSNPLPNIFVFGRTARSATLVISEGLLRWLNQEELKAVIAHEVGHLYHKDYLIMTSLGSIPILYYTIGKSIIGVTRSLFRSLRGIIFGIAFALLFGPIAIISFILYLITKLIVLTLSRLREFYSDAYAAYLTRNPRALMSALTKIAYGLSLNPWETFAATNAFFIEDPAHSKNEIKRIAERAHDYDIDKDGTLDEKELQIAMEQEAKKFRFSRLKSIFSTHPPTYKRILLLKKIEKEMSSGKYTTKNIYKYI